MVGASRRGLPRRPVGAAPGRLQDSGAGGEGHPDAPLLEVFGMALAEHVAQAEVGAAQVHVAATRFWGGRLQWKVGSWAAQHRGC